MDYKDMPNDMLVKLLAQARAAEAIAKKNGADIKRVLNERFKTTGQFPMEGGLILAVTPYSRFDAATAIKNLSAAKVKLISKTAPDGMLAKARLSPDDYDLTKKSYDHALTVTFNE